MISLRMPNVVGTCKPEKVGKAKERKIKRIREERCLRRNAVYAGYDDDDDDVNCNQIWIDRQHTQRLVTSPFPFFRFNDFDANNNAFLLQETVLVGRKL